MQKKLIALAVASLASGAAFAQTNVTMYGIADAGYVYSQGDAAGSGTNKFSGVQSGLLSGSRLGFKGEEALGNGLKAIFTLEYSLNLDNNTGVGSGSGGLFARQQFVGLSGAFGTAALGRQYAPAYLATANNDAFGGALFAPQSYLSQQAGNTITPNSGARWDNAMTYTSPNWGGFTGKAIYSFGETQDAAGGFNDNFVSTSDNGRWGLGANFAAGAFNVDGVYQVRQNVTAFGGNDINEWYVGGSFDLKFVKLMASYQDQNDKNVTNNDNSTWSLGAVIPFGNSNIHVGYAQTDYDAGVIDGKSDSFALAYTYNFSKRTTLYAGYVWGSNDRDSRPTGPVAGLSLTGARGEDSNTFLAGVRHSF
ncbi:MULTISPECIES: porin [Candidatus Accumulibacter]|jgi:predicted porin|uniref:porin n=1 Tax=Candidatus Accumulibacter TaxID=327159 RepID=UPI001AD2257F|nr:porin [Accumulibacter sp.]MBN8449005.1 porin [Candidatus Accumulibacter necessarius]MBN8495932.1 porin [Accumulibacter sp.]